MAKLVVSSAGTVVLQRFVDAERLTIGRERHNDIVIDDPSVSREHAAIASVGNDHILEDLGSVNGTLVNGVAMPRRILQHGDVVAFGISHPCTAFDRRRVLFELDDDDRVVGAIATMF